jgi:predicted phage tail component-like protein
MNYVILNGIKSTLIKGLLIQSLPPITKPSIRTKAETIDGRDGDLVTKLGYAAYDKPMSIGLFGDFSIDEVIEYFNTEGTVIFSNEPDKFYKYQILQQIDFEKLIRFKKATVVFHVQPFKLSAVDDDFTVTKNQMTIRPYEDTRFGVTVKEAEGIVTVKGTAQATTEFYLPIKPMILAAGDYTVEVAGTGTGLSSAQIRVIGSVPSDADTLGGQALTLDTTAELQAELEEEKSFNYLWITVANGAEMDFLFTVNVMDESFSSFKLFNRGNYEARPTLTIEGVGDITLDLNGAQLFDIALADMGLITINAEEMNAYKGDDLMNRYVSGDYNALRLNIGTNVISWTGNITSIKVENESRWI